MDNHHQVIKHCKEARFIPPSHSLSRNRAGRRPLPSKGAGWAPLAQHTGADARRPPALIHSGFTPVALGAEENPCLMLEQPPSSPQTGETRGLTSEEPDPPLTASSPEPRSAQTLHQLYRELDPGIGGRSVLHTCACSARKTWA